MSANYVLFPILKVLFPILSFVSNFLSFVSYYCSFCKEAALGTKDWPSPTYFAAFSSICSYFQHIFQIIYFGTATFYLTSDCIYYLKTRDNFLVSLYFSVHLNLNLGFKEYIFLFGETEMDIKGVHGPPCGNANFDSYDLDVWGPLCRDFLRRRFRITCASETRTHVTKDVSGR